MEKYPEETVVRVKDENYRPYIMLKDADDKLYWRPYGFEPIEEVRKFHKWELEAQKKFRDESRSPDELDYLRQLIMAIGLVNDFFDLGDDNKQEFIGGLITKISIIWYCKDKNLDAKTFLPDSSDEQQTKDLCTYFQLAMFYVNSFLMTLTRAAECANTPDACK